MNDKQLYVDMIGLAGACSYALDCIESEIFHVKNRHGKRVAYMSVCMAKYFGITGDALQDLAVCALLHDNALAQYIAEELQDKQNPDSAKDITKSATNFHCVYGEKNIAQLPFQTDVSNVILYHHERADGTGAFQKKWHEVPFLQESFIWLIVLM